MRTDDLISAIASDASGPAPRPAPALWAALGLAVLAAAVVFSVVLHVRPDVEAALHTVRYPLKFVLVGCFAAAALFAALRFARPGANPAPVRAALVLALAALVAAVVVEMLVTPAGDWSRKIVGRNWMLCLASIPMLSALPLAILLIGLRRGAPDRPAALGAVAGLLAGTVGALFYAAHCFDDSPLFVAAWYSLAIAAMTGIGAFAGGRLLRW